MASNKFRIMSFAALALAGMAPSVAAVASGVQDLSFDTFVPTITVIYPSPPFGPLTVAYVPYATENFEAPVTQMATLTQTPAASTATITVAVDAPSGPNGIRFDSFIPTITAVYPSPPFGPVTVNYIPLVGTSVGAGPDVVMTTATESMAAGTTTITVLSVDYHTANHTSKATGNGTNVMSDAIYSTTYVNWISTSTSTTVVSSTVSATTSTSAPPAATSSSAAVPNMTNPVRSVTRGFKAFLARVFRSLDAPPGPVLGNREVFEKRATPCSSLFPYNVSICGNSTGLTLLPYTGAATPSTSNPFAYATKQTKKVFSRATSSIYALTQSVFDRADHLHPTVISGTMLVNTSTAVVNPDPVAPVGSTNWFLHSPDAPNCNDCYPVRMVISPMCVATSLLFALILLAAKWGSWRNCRRGLRLYTPEAVGFTLLFHIAAFLIFIYVELYVWRVQPQLLECIHNGCYVAMSNGTIPLPRYHLH